MQLQGCLARTARAYRQGSVADDGEDDDHDADRRCGGMCAHTRARRTGTGTGGQARGNFHREPRRRGGERPVHTPVGGPGSSHVRAMY